MEGGWAEKGGRSGGWVKAAKHCADVAKYNNIERGEEDVDKYGNVVTSR